MDFVGRARVFSNQSRELSSFPTPEDLWQRWEQYRRQTTAQFPSKGVAKTRGFYATKLQQINPLLYPFCSASICGKEPRYFQEVAIRRVIERMMAAQKLSERWDKYQE